MLVINICTRRNLPEEAWMRHLVLLLTGLSFLGLAHPNTGLAQDLSAKDATDNLRREMEAQFRRQAAQIDQLRRELDAVTERVRNFKVSVGRPTTRKIAGTPGGTNFWDNVPDNEVNFTCGDNEVLAGVNFVMHAQNGSRGPIRVEYICKALGP